MYEYFSNKTVTDKNAIIDRLIKSGAITFDEGLVLADTVLQPANNLGTVTTPLPYIQPGTGTGSPYWWQCPTITC